MSTLLLRLAGPLQSWGSDSRFTERRTRMEPTRSGVVGLLAAASGIERDGDLSAFNKLRFGVRVDQQGSVLSDFQTAIDSRGDALPLSYRQYLQDAVFLVGLEGEDEFLRELVTAIRSPRFPLSLGRRSCIPSQPLVVDIVDDGLMDALRSADWVASDWFKRRHSRVGYQSRIVVDAEVAQEGEDGVSIRTQDDVPVSFAIERRVHSARRVATVPFRFTDAPNSEADFDALEVLP